MLKRIRKAIVSALEVDEPDEAAVAMDAAMSCGNEKLFAEMNEFVSSKGSGAERREWQKLLDSCGIYSKKFTKNSDWYYWSACNRYAKLCYSDTGRAGKSLLKISSTNHDAGDIAASVRSIKRNSKNANALVIDFPGLYNANVTFLMTAKFLASTKSPVDYRMFGRSPGLMYSAEKRISANHNFSKHYKNYLRLLADKIFAEHDPDRELCLRASDIGVFDALFVLRYFIELSAKKKMDLPRMRLELSDVDLAMPILSTQMKNGTPDDVLKKLCNSISSTLNKNYYGYDKSLLAVDIVIREDLVPGNRMKRSSDVAAHTARKDFEQSHLDSATKKFIQILKHTGQVSWCIMPRKSLEDLYARSSVAFLDTTDAKVPPSLQNQDAETILPVVSGKDILGGIQKSNTSIGQQGIKK